MNLNMDKRKLAAAGLLTAVLIGGGASIAAASDDGSAPAATSSGVGQEPDGETNDGPDGGPGSEQEGQDPAFTGSVVAPAETEQADGQESSRSEDQEQASLQALATLTPEQAEQAALAAVPGTAAETDLGNGGPERRAGLIGSRRRTTAAREALDALGSPCVRLVSRRRPLRQGGAPAFVPGWSLVRACGRVTGTTAERLARAEPPVAGTGSRRSSR
jgi:hypothetical protein